jgi:hypothetical protein
MSQNCGHQQAYCSSPDDTVIWRTMEKIMPCWDNSWVVHQSSLAVPPAEMSGASRSNVRRSKNFAHQCLKCFKGSVTCRKILGHGISGFTSHPKEGVLRIFIAVKNPWPWPGLNPRALSPAASTLTTTPLRRHLLTLSGTLCSWTCWYPTWEKNCVRAWCI